MIESSGEARLEIPLMEWLQRSRRVRSDTVILREFPWFGRRVDLVTLTCSGIATAYELKLNNTKRAIHQAGYNKLVFDRSYVVTLSHPTPMNLKHAHDSGVGFIVLTNNTMRLVQESPLDRAHRTLRHRLLRAMYGKSQLDV